MTARNNTKSSESLRPQIHSVAIEIGTELPSLNTEGLKSLMEGDLISSSRKDVLRFSSIQTFRDRHNKVNHALLRAVHLREEEGLIRDIDELRAHCIATSNLLLALLLEAPEGTEIFQRNPKKELPRAANIILENLVDNTQIPIMVPVCPDTSGYVLGDGIGDVLPKGIEYSVMFESVFKKHEIPTIFDIQVADVEGLDPVILKNTGETTDSHFMKTKGTIEKGRSEIERRKLGSVVAVRSMLEAFTEAGLDFREVQIEAANKIRSSQNRQVANVVDGLIKERVRLGNFVRFDDATKRELVINELASYAAFGEMSGGDAIILSPDAKSAVPAYHFSIDDNNKFSPVIYAS